MLKTFIGKFTFFFWFVFIIINIPFYVFGTVYFKNVLKMAEEEKISLLFRAITPIIALNISFDQQDQLSQILAGTLQDDDVHSIRLTLFNGQKDIFNSKNTKISDKTLMYESSIFDPFSNKEIAKLSLNYSSQHVENLQSQILTTIFFISLFALIVFTLFFLYIRKDFNTLKNVSKSLQNYSRSKKNSPIVLKNPSLEISTIAKVSNEMMSNIAKHVHLLQSFNEELQKQVQEKMQELLRQEQLILHTSRQAAMGEMLESIAHQWRQPLNIIGLATANLETQRQLKILSDKDFADKMELIALNINYMSDTIDDFRNFLNPAREISDFEPQTSVQEVFKILDAQLQANNIAYSVQTDANILFQGVENEFKQVLLILINNAKDALKEHRKTDRKIVVRFYKEGDKGFVDVTDNGGGIQEDVLASIFDPYFTTKFASKGTGIGLHIAKNIIQTRMKGAIIANNTQDGCRFTIELPINEKDKIE